MSYEFDGVRVNGSTLGRAYTAQGLQRRLGVNYDPKRDDPVLARALACVPIKDGKRTWTVADRNLASAPGERNARTRRERDHHGLNTNERQILNKVGTFRVVSAGDLQRQISPSNPERFRQDVKRLVARGLVESQSDVRRKIDYRPPALERRAIVHGHCHQKAIMGLKPTEEILSGMGVKAEVLDSGCCGMAGSFGFESEHYDASMKIGEHTLLPKVRSTPKDQLIIASGFSCREQILQGSDRRPLHLAEVVAMALNKEQQPISGSGGNVSAAWKRVAIAAGAAAVAFTAAALIRRR